MLENRKMMTIHGFVPMNVMKMEKRENKHKRDDCVSRGIE